MKYWYIILAIGIVACGTPESPKSEKLSDKTENVNTTSYMSYGTKIKANGALPVKELETAIEGKDTVFIKLEATIIETCPKKGCWMTVDVGNEEEIMVRFTDYGFFVPTEEQEGKTAIFEGRAFRDTVDVETLQHYAEDAGKPQEEIDQITEPEITIAFLADGVIIKQ